jgi:HAD superfamily hydrolase (TIGR01509 family)
MGHALLWDVDGTLVESERDGHRAAFNLAFEAAGLPWRWDVEGYGALLRITGGRERILQFMRSRSDAPALDSEREALARELHRRKVAFYQGIVAAGGVPLRAGVRELMDEALAAGWWLGIVTTTSAAGLRALLEHHFGARWEERFAVWVCGEDVRAKKPDPQAYQRALAALAIGPLEAIALEDSPGGVAAARAADVPVIVTRSAYFPHDTVEGAIAVGPGLHTRAGWRPALTRESAATRVTLDDVLEWRSRMEYVSAFG